ADGTTELLVPSTVRGPWCYLYGTTEPLEYCSTPGQSMNFDTSGAPYHHDHTIYQWDAIRFVDDGAGGFTVDRRPTAIEAPLGWSTPDDYFGDGLLDISFTVRRDWGQTNGGTVPLGDYASPGGYGNKVARNLGPAPD